MSRSRAEKSCKETGFCISWTSRSTRPWCTTALGEVSGHEEDFQLGAQFRCSLRKLPPVHPGHHDVGKHEINPDGRLLEDGQSGQGILCTEGAIIQVAQYLDQVGAQILVVLNHQDCR